MEFNAPKKFKCKAFHIMEWNLMLLDLLGNFYLYNVIRYH